MDLQHLSSELTKIPLVYELLRKNVNAVKDIEVINCEKDIDESLSLLSNLQLNNLSDHNISKRTSFNIDLTVTKILISKNHIKTTILEDDFV